MATNSSEPAEQQKFVKNLRGEVDPQLDLIIRRWPTLPVTIRQEILKLIL